jgi:hypothetical protein
MKIENSPRVAALGQIWLTLNKCIPYDLNLSSPVNWPERLRIPNELSLAGNDSPDLVAGIE